MAVCDNIKKLGQRLTEILEYTTVVNARQQKDSSYEITVKVGAVTDGQQADVSVRDIRLLKDERCKTHSLIVSVPVEQNDQDIGELQGAIDIVETETKKLIIDRLYDFDIAKSTELVKRLEQAVKELEAVAVALDGHKDADNLLADLEIAERYINKAKQDIETSFIASMREAGKAYKEKISFLNEKLTLDDILGQEA